MNDEPVDVGAMWAPSAGDKIQFAVIYDDAKPRGWKRVLRFLTRGRYPSPVLAFMDFRDN